MVDQTPTPNRTKLAWPSAKMQFQRLSLALVCRYSRSGAFWLFHTGKKAPFSAITTIHDDTDKEIPGSKTALSYSFGNLWDPADPALIELKKADNVKGTRCMKFSFSSGAKVYFDSYPSASLAPGGSKGEAVTTQTSFKLTGPITAYAT